MADFLIGAGAAASVILLIVTKVRAFRRKSTCCGCCGKCENCGVKSKKSNKDCILPMNLL
ncbi:MAG TPA: hypothetical protein VHO94_02780 [Oscillospiraceae bacterium]|nr:hypothetical protein [Oscillospiraceae bacterium]